MTRLLGLCHGQLLARVEESDFPINCEWIVPMTQFIIPAIFTIVAVATLASLIHSCIGLARAYRELED